MTTDTSEKGLESVIVAAMTAPGPRGRLWTGWSTSRARSTDRTRLITDVITGKVDVREAAAGLPDEVDGLEMVDEESGPAEGEESLDGDPADAPADDE